MRLQFGITKKQHDNNSRTDILIIYRKGHRPFPTNTLLNSYILFITEELT